MRIVADDADSGMERWKKESQWAAPTLAFSQFRKQKMRFCVCPKYVDFSAKR